MIINLTRLSREDRAQYDLLMAYAREHGNLNIGEAAELCHCSPSRISKFIKKIGFVNFKQFVRSALGEISPANASTNELLRIRDFIDHFDTSIVDEFIREIKKHERIIILGYGPSYYCAQYLEYKLRLHSDRFIVAVPDLLSAQSQMTENSLVVIFSVTGQFASLQEVCESAEQRGAKVLAILEEYHPELLENDHSTIFLTQTVQNPKLPPYNKSRTLFFIFIEEVIFRIMQQAETKE